MGARTLRKYIEQPLIDKNAIEKRLDAVDELMKNAISREEIREYLSPVYESRTTGNAKSHINLPIQEI